MSAFRVWPADVELMAGYWPTADTQIEPARMRDFAAIWKVTPKIVFSRTLERVDHGARLVRDDVVAAEVRPAQGAARLRMGVGGPTIASRRCSMRGW